MDVDVIISVRIAKLVSARLRSLYAGVDGAEVPVVATSWWPSDAAKLLCTHLGAIAVNAVVTGGVVWAEPAAVEALVAGIHRAID
jgi:hypothetical protein